MLVRRTHLPEEIREAYFAAAGRGKRRQPPPVQAFSGVISRKIVSVSSKIAFVLRRLRERSSVSYHSLYDGAQSRSDLVATFLAVLELITELYAHHSVPRSEDTATVRAPQDYVKKTLEFIAEHYTEKTSLEEIACVCGITKYHLAREFKRYTGHTVITHLNVLRCRRADVCLSEGMTVTEAAMASGFESVSYFSRTYKKIMGVSPLFERKQRSRRGSAEKRA